jgi:hypothetical protein
MYRVDSGFVQNFFEIFLNFKYLKWCQLIRICYIIKIQISTNRVSNVLVNTDQFGPNTIHTD